MVLLELFFFVLAYALGSLPLGYWLYQAEGRHPNTLSPHNLGIENVWRTLGPLPTVLAFLGDALKGFVAVGLTLGLNSPEAAVLAGLGAMLGHFYPPRAFFEGAPPRGRGNIVLLGVLAGWSAVGLPLWSLLIALLAFGGVLGYSGFAALSSVVALTLLTLFLSFSGLNFFAVLLVWTLLALYLWRSKEQLGRILDGTEPRVGESVPVTGRDPNQVVAAFMVHPMNTADLWQTGRFRWLEPLFGPGKLPITWALALSEHVRPMKVDELRGIYTLEGKEIRCYLIGAPLLPQVISSKPELAAARAIQGARLARELGASVFGLGAFWSTVGNKGLDVQAAVPELAVTNGGAYTAGTVRASIPTILEHFAAQGRDPKTSTAAVVGANGVVAFGIARTIAPQVGRLILVGRDPVRLERSRLTLEKAFPLTCFESGTDMASISSADLIFSATSDPNPVIFPQHVKPGVWIFDEGRPADVDASVLNMPGVRLIPGGVVRPPGSMSQRLDMGFGEGLVPACLAETLIIAANGCFERVSLGAQTSSENIAYFVAEAEKLGFEVIG